MLHGNIANRNSVILFTDKPFDIEKSTVSITMKFSSSIFTLPALLCALMLGSLGTGPVEANDDVAKVKNIVVSIKPLYSLASMLVEGTGDSLSLLIQQNQSPHHYNMRPSERRLLAEADIIVWVGPSMESFLDKIMRRQTQATIITAIEADGLIKLKRHAKHSHTEHEDHIAHDTIDPHIWLSTHNAIAISKQIHDQLVRTNPHHSKRYASNLKKLLEKIEQTRLAVSKTLSGKEQPYISYHDAFRYFSDENELNYVDSVTFDEESGASVKHLRELKSEIQREQIRCLVYQEPKPALVDRLRHVTGINAVVLDPLGIDTSDENAWFEIMQQLADGFSDCLSSTSH